MQVLRWNAPVDDAGTEAGRITGYRVRMLVQPDDLERTFDFEAQCYGEIPRLTYQKQYRFEVCALNAAGYGLS